MPLIAKDGSEVILARPEIPENSEYKKPKPFKKIPYLTDYGIREIHPPIHSQYRVEKVVISFYLPVFVAISFRNYADPLKRCLSDVLTDMLMDYFDAKFPGWDGQIIDRPVAQGHKYIRQKDINTGSKRGSITGCSRGRIKGEKVVVRFHISRSVHVTVKSVAISKGWNMSDVVTEAIMFYLDENVPGWDLAGDIPDDPKTP